MASALKVTGIVLGVVLVLGVVIGSITWAVLASRDPSPEPPELRPLDWWENTVIYQIYPRSFMDSDGDGIGDLKGITSKLEHFVDAGVGAIWMSPIFVSPMIDFGYDISDFYDIHHEYGTLADFDELVAKAHELGIKVLLDYVPNHASTESIYFQRSEARDPEYDNYFVWADPKIDPDNDTNLLVPSNWISQFGGSVWEWSDIRQQYYLHQFAIEQADFNFREPAVRQEMINIMQYWIERGADGFRVDAIPHLFEANPDDHDGEYPDEPWTGNGFLNPDQPGYTTQEHVRDLMELYDVVYEWRDFVDRWKAETGSETKLLLAEAYASITMTMLYYGDERGRVGAHFPFNFDFITSLWAGSNARDFVYVIQRWLTYMPHGEVANWVFGNHDNNRMPSRFRENMVDGLNALNMLLPGVAVTYQGEELGMKDGYVSWEDTVDVAACNQGNSDNYLDYSRDPARTPYHWDNTTSAGFSTNTSTWLPIAEDYIEINLQKQKEDARSHYKVYQILTRLRKEPALSHGSYHIEALTENTLVLVRYLMTHDTYVLVFNVGTVADTVDLTRVEHLRGDLTVVTSSVHSSRETGTTIPLADVTVQSGVGVTKQLSYIRALGADAVILSPVAQKSTDCSKPGTVGMPAIDQRYGGLDQFSGLLEKAKKLELKVLATLNLQTASASSENFASSAKRVSGFADWYVWAEGAPEQPPQIQDGIDQWIYHESRNAFYATRSNESILNLCSEDLRSSLAATQCAWLRRGVTGLVLNPDYKDRECGVKLLRKLAAEAVTCARGSNLEAPIILVETSLSPEEAAKYYGDSGIGAHSILSNALTMATRSTPELGLAFFADMLYAPQDNTVTWQTSAPDANRIATRHGSDMVDVINLLNLMLPGAAIIQQGDELGVADTILEWASSETCWPNSGTPSSAPFPWDDTVNGGFSAGTPWLPLPPNYRYANAKAQFANDGSHVGVVRVAAAMRKSPAMGPHTEMKRLGDALAILRWGGAGTLLLVSNVGKDQTELQLLKMGGLPAEMTVAISSSGSAFGSGSHINLDKTMKLSPGETILLAGGPRHCGGPGPVDKIANKLTEGWQKLNKYFSNFK